jgi:hypothetical protein
MKSFGLDCIDYWQPTTATRRGLKNRFGIRVETGRCWALIQIGDYEASTFGKSHEIPVDLTTLPIYMQMIVNEYQLNCPSSDLLDLLTGKISFRDARRPPAKIEVKRITAAAAVRLPNAS